MCGIIGIVNRSSRPILLEELQSMCAAIYHRGPDEDGFYLGQDAGMGMRRLSIIDLKTGKQPISNEDGSVSVVFNGEIYNYQQLRQELQSRGHCLATTTDTETIVHLYEDYGEKCVEHLRGMFAFALWDERRKTLLLARDRLGIKPLYYGEINGRLVFASEIKAILQLPEIPRQLNWHSVSYLFTFLNTPPGESIVEGIHKLLPAHTMVAKPGRPLEIKSYWNLAFQPDNRRTEADTVEQLKELLDESVRLHMVSDVPVGAFLSGGIDSSAVVSYMARNTSARLKTFSIGFTESDFNELRFARVMADRLGTDHHELVLKPDALDILDDLAWYLDEPLGDSSAIPTYMVSKLAAQHLKVVLSGDGGDELFAGYDKYAVEGFERNYDRIPGPLRGLLGYMGNNLPQGVRGRNLLRHISLQGRERIFDATTTFRPHQKKDLFQEDAYSQMASFDPWKAALDHFGPPQQHWLSTLQHMDFMSYLPLDILVKVDRMSMAHSLEARVPLLDHKVVEFAATIPPELKLHRNVRKHIFKKALRGTVPDAILDRPKRGFAIPLGHWFRSEHVDFVREVLLSDTSRRRGIFRPQYIEQLLWQNKKGRELDLHLWSLMSFEMWCRTFLDGAKIENQRLRSAGRDPAKVQQGVA